MWNTREIFWENEVYHVYNRSLTKETIFHNQKEFERFFKVLEKYRKEYTSLELIAYCILPNHFHFVIKNKKEWYFLSEFMKRLQGSYATWYRMLYPQEFKQAVFNGRFHSKRIDSEEYLKQCIAYVCLNPVKHGIVQDISEYPYSSYSQNFRTGPKILAYSELDELEI